MANIDKSVAQVENYIERAKIVCNQEWPGIEDYYPLAAETIEIAKMIQTEDAKANSGKS